MRNFTLPHNHHSDEIKNAFLKMHLDKIQDFEITADIFKQLADTSRLRIFWLLCHSEECVINISFMLDMTPPNVSHHLKQLRKSNLITCARKGKEVYYKALNNKQTKLLHIIIEEIIKINCINKIK